MSKLLTLIIPAVLFSFYSLCEGLECYHCYSDEKSAFKSDFKSAFVSCNEKNLSASNTWVCPHQNARCVIKKMEVTVPNKGIQTWRTCSDGISDPCDPNSVPPGSKLISCSHCGTDKCNLYHTGKNGTENSFTFNINANINLYIRQ